MKPFGILPPGVRLDAWVIEKASQPAEDAPEVARLREELRKSMPELTCVLEMLAKLRPAQDLAARLAGPPPAQLIHQKS
jgi:hypothetical protein